MAQRGKSAQTRKTPDFLVIGPQKSGTTWIHQYFESRGDVSLPEGVKETFFFARRYERGIDWYANHFRNCNQPQPIAEVAPSYFHSKRAAERIHQEIGTVPLVCSLRHPAKRSHSLYLHMKRFGVTRLGFRDAVAKHPVILESSRYHTHLKRWIELFGRERILVLFLETLAQDPNAYAQALCAHLRIPFKEVESSLKKPVNGAAVPLNSHLAKIVKMASDRVRSAGLYGVIERAKKLGLKELVFGRPGAVQMPKMSQEDCLWVQHELEDEIESLESLLELDLSHWKPEAAESIAA